MNKFKLFTQLSAILLCSSAVTMNHAAATKAVPLDKMVAIVNDSVITQSELTEVTSAMKKQMAASNVTTPPADVMRKQVLDQMINKKLQLQLAEQLGVKVTEDDVDKTVRNIADSNKISVDELYLKVNEQGGLTKSAYRKELHEQITMQQVQQQAVAAKINISQQEVNDFLRSKAWQAFNTKEYHLEDILIALPENPTPQDLAAAKTHAESVLAKLRQGTSFGDAAASESGQPNALQGGDLGWRKLPEVPAVFSNELVHMKAGDFLGPVQTPNGYHIVKLAGLRSNEIKLSTIQKNQQVRELIFQRKIEEGMQNWLSKLRSEAFINLNPKA